MKFLVHPMGPELRSPLYVSPRYTLPPFTIVPVTAGAGGVTAGSLVAVDNTGAVVAVTQTAAGSQPAKWVVGRALTAAAAGNDAEVELVDPFLY